MRFSDTFQIKVLEERGEVRISVRTNDERIDEFFLPINDFSDIIERKPSNIKFSTESVWIRGIDKIALGIKTGETQWCIYIFNPHNWSILRENFISQLREKNINSISIIGMGSSPFQNNSICNYDFSSTIDGLLKRVELLERSVNSLVGNQSLILSQISQLTQLSAQQFEQNQQIHEDVDPEMETESEDDFEDFETATFIPTVEVKAESETIITEEQSQESDLLDTVQKLKQLRKKRKK